jgi:hypothetical protein
MGETEPKLRVDGWGDRDLYAKARRRFAAKIVRLQGEGRLLKPAELPDAALEAYFDHLDQLYGQICRELGLPWPPPPLEKEG